MHDLPPATTPISPLRQRLIDDMTMRLRRSIEKGAAIHRCLLKPAKSFQTPLKRRIPKMILSTGATL